MNYTQLSAIAARFRKHETEDTYPIASINDDLSDMTKLELEEQVIAVTKRLEKGIVKPEGIDGLHYRLARLQAQLRVLEKGKT